MSHTHECCRCGQIVPCDGDLERNEDGWPAVICRAFHLPNGSIARVVCEDCVELEDRIDQDEATA